MPDTAHDQVVINDIDVLTIAIREAHARGANDERRRIDQIIGDVAATVDVAALRPYLASQPSSVTYRGRAGEMLLVVRDVELGPAPPGYEVEPTPEQARTIARRKLANKLVEEALRARSAA